MSTPETIPEFSRPSNLAKLGDAPKTVTLKANETECQALAERFGLVEIASLEAKIELKSMPRGVVAGTGELTAHVTQRCIVTLAPVKQEIAERIDVLFVPEPLATSEAEDEDTALDWELIAPGGNVDLGEYAAQVLSLGLDPYPRSDQAGNYLEQLSVSLDQTDQSDCPDNNKAEQIYTSDTPRSASNASHADEQSNQNDRKNQDQKPGKGPKSDQKPETHRPFADLGARLSAEKNRKN